ncbi:S8 family serine peptidase [Streptomyces sp. NPDC051561]|uniref:S8 family serine peptidase n=1 Tax=Streptomyces sp. NPDC051561 TaxID=3365658 RepID=UPI0037A3B0BC
MAGATVGETHGVAGRARFAGVRVLDAEGPGTTAQVGAGIDRVAKNARRPAVAHTSLDGEANASLETAVRNAIKAKVGFVVAAGNDGLPVTRYSPARVQEALTVGATDIRGNRAASLRHLDGVPAQGRCGGAPSGGPGVGLTRGGGQGAHRAVRGRVKGAHPGLPNLLLQVNNP